MNINMIDQVSNCNIDYILQQVEQCLNVRWNKQSELQRKEYGNQNSIQDYLEKMKEKKIKEQEERLLQQKKEQIKKENLKKKILEEAIKIRENKIKDIKELNLQQSNPQTDVLPRILKSANVNVQIDTQKYQNQIREDSFIDYSKKNILFLQQLNKNFKAKKQKEKHQLVQKQQRINKFKEGLDFDNVQSKLGILRTVKAVSTIKQIKQKNQMTHSHSAEKFASLLQIAEAQMPKTNKHFKRKNQEYIQKIKQKREQVQQNKEEQREKKQRLKQKLKEYVMTTVKKNVIEGVYDQEEQEDQSEQESKKKSRKMRSFPYVTDITQWRKKNRLQNNEKVFIITGGYNDLKKALKQRGWVRNPDSSSNCFDLKFTLQGRQIQFDKLQNFQLANHYQKNGVITTKLGLTKTLRNLQWITDTSSDIFYPKCFDLNDEDDFSAFETYFKICKAVSILKIYVDCGGKSEQKILLQQLKRRVEVALNVCSKNIQDVHEILDAKKTPKIVTDKQWQILASDELDEQGLAKKKHQEWLKSIDSKFVVVKPKLAKKKQSAVAFEEQDTSNDLLQKAKDLLKMYEQKFVQYSLTSHNNIWILKPAGLSRGRGITCFNNFVQIQDHIKCKQSLWIAQKYIENPLIILKRKFDIRQWVLITDFNPLTIWSYDECYLRFSALDYNAKQVNNKFVHLTNNSIGAHHSSFQKSAIKGNMFFQHQFSDYLKQIAGYDVFAEKIKPQFTSIIKQSMQCAIDGIQHRKNTHQLFGYDFMVDENYKVWLIEINSSPAMDYSTHVTAKLVKQMLTDLPCVIVDYAEASKKQKKHIPTGKFKRIYKGIQIYDKVTTTGLNLCIQGVPLKKSKKNAIKVQNFNLSQPNSKQQIQNKKNSSKNIDANKKIVSKQIIKGQKNIIHQNEQNVIQFQQQKFNNNNQNEHKKNTQEQSQLDRQSNTKQYEKIQNLQKMNDSDS